VNSAPAISDSRILNVIESSATALGLSHQRMPSGAGHDAQEVAHIAPMAMIFVPSVGGISHSPKEFSRADDIANGANVLMNAVVEADRVIE
jgi:N-carbamoyl-L-amino-acid hydrolase